MKYMKKGGKSRFPDLNKDGKITMADILKGRGVGRRKRKAAGGMYVRPGSQMGVGGALLTLGKNIAQGKKLGSGALKGVLRAGVTPGSGVSAGLGLAGTLAGKSNNPALQKIGKGLGAAGNVAGMFTGGGGGGLGKLAKGAMGALAGGGGGAGGGLGALAKGAMGALGGGGAAAGGGGGALAGLAKGALGALIADKGMKVSYEDGGKMSYGHGGSIMGKRKPMLIIKMDEGGVTGDPIKDGEDEDVRMMGGTEILGGDPISGDLLGVRLPSETTQSVAGLPSFGYGELYSDPESDPFDAFEEIPEDTPPSGMKIIKRVPPQLIEQDIEKDITGGVEDVPESDLPEVSAIDHTPTTSNLRVFKGKKGGGAMLYGGSDDAFAKGFRVGNQAFYASPEVYDLMRKEGVNPNDPYAVEFMEDLQKNSPELFSNKNEFNNVINSMVMKEAKEDPVYGRGFFISKQKIKAPSFNYGGKVM